MRRERKSIDKREIKRDEPLRRRTRWAINYVAHEKDLTNIKMANLLGVNEGTISNYRVMNTSPKADFIDKFCEDFGFNKDWFLSGQGEPFPGARIKYSEICGPEELGYAVNESQKKYEPGEFVFIPQFRSPISAGTGLIPDENIEMRVAFRRDWMRRKGDPKNMSLIKISGDSMEPTFYAGDLVLINHSRNYLDPQGGIYAIAINNSIMVKRVLPDLHAGKVKIISDNPKYPPIDVDLDQVKINGKVIWFAREIEND